MVIRDRVVGDLARDACDLETAMALVMRRKWLVIDGGRAVRLRANERDFLAVGKGLVKELYPVATQEHAWLVGGSLA